MKKHVHLFGASGSGTTSLSKKVAEALHYDHFDSDDYFWLQTETPFTVERPRAECLAMMNADLKNSKRWVLSGSLANWGNSLIPLFDLAVFVTVPKEIRLERLEKRERERYGNNVLPGGTRYEAYREFLEWAAAYEDGTREGRSLKRHEEWLKNLACPVVRMENLDFDKSVDAVLKAVNDT